MSVTHAPVPTDGYVSAAAPNGWLEMAAITLGVAGVMRIFDAIWAFRYSGVLPANLEDAIFGNDLDTYGWVYLVVAALLIGAAVMVHMGSQAARWFGVVVASLGAISAVWWMPYYPIWSLIYVGLAIVVIYALVVQGGRPAAR
jgi:hypothetical protein